MIRNIPSSAIAQAATTNRVPVADITVISNRMRRLRPDVVDELAESIAAQGLLHPITLRKRAIDGALVQRRAGERCHVGNGRTARGLTLDRPFRPARLLGRVGSVAINVVAILATTSLRSIHPLCLRRARLRLGMQPLVNLLALGLVRGPLGRREVGTD